MKKSSEIIMSLGLMLTYAAFSVWMFSLNIIQHDYTGMTLRFGSLIFYLAAVCLIDRLVSDRGINLAVYGVMQLIFFALGIYIFLRCASTEPVRLGSVITHGVIYSLGVLPAAYCGFEPAKQKTVSLCFDVNIIMMIITLLLGHYITLYLTPEVMFSCVAATVLTLIALIVARVDAESAASSVRGDPAAGKALIVVVFIVAAAATGAIAAFAFGGVKSVSEALLAAVTAIAAAAKNAGLFLYGALERFMLWLSSFSSGESIAEEPVIMPGGVGNADFSFAEGEASIPAYFYVILAVFLLAVLTLVFLSMRRARLSSRRKRRAKRRSSVVVRESGLLDAIRRFFSSAVSAVCFRLLYIRNRKTPAGLLVLCQRRSRRSLPRLTGESGERFLMRLSENVDDGELSRSLVSLSSLVSESFYSPHPAAVPDELYKSIRRSRFRLKNS